MAGLKRSKTEDKLKDAFSVGSQANRGYRHFARIADWFVTLAKPTVTWSRKTVDERIT